MLNDSQESVGYHLAAEAAPNEKQPRDYPQRVKSDDEIAKKFLGNYEIAQKILDEIHGIRLSAESIPKEIRELRILFARIERMGGFK